MAELNSEEKLARLHQEIDFALSGTGCSTLLELRMAFDHLKEVLYLNHNDIYTSKRIARIVSENIYKIKQIDFEGTCD